MALLQKSIEKREALLRATLSLVNNGGIQGASMAKVAKLASVSPATIYLYFESKQDLVNQLYLNVKTAFAMLHSKITLLRKVSTSLSRKYGLQWLLIS